MKMRAALRPIKRPCDGCGAAVLRHPCRLKKYRRCFCSRICRMKNQFGVENPNWRGVRERRACCTCSAIFAITTKESPGNPKIFCSRKCSAVARIVSPERRRQNQRNSWRRYDVRLRATVALFGHHTEEEWLSLLAKCGGRCLRCGTSDDIQRDHILPLSRGGNDLIENIQPLCGTCNKSKNARYEIYGL